MGDLACDGVAVRYPDGTLALDGAHLALEAGRIHGVLGENGAGKSTLLGALVGLVPATAGSLVVDGAPQPAFGSAAWTPAVARARGLGMVHQHFSLVESLTVAENVALGAEPRRAFALFDRRRARAFVRELSARWGLAVPPDARVRELSVGEQQKVEILKALGRDAQVLLLDEPTAVLAPPEVASLFAVLRGLAATGRAIAITTHKLGEVAALCHSVTVLRAGRVAGEAPMDRVTPDEIARWMIGRDLAARPPRRRTRPGPIELACEALEVDGDRGEPALRGCSFDVRRGEVVGIAGVAGNGQRELVEAVAGLRPVRAGEVLLAAGGSVAVVHEDRRRHGGVEGMSVADNAVLGRHRDPAFCSAAGAMRRGAIHREAVRLAAVFDVRPAEPQLPLRALSGGNQQKLVVARELAKETTALVASQPTRGVDLGATRSIHDAIEAARERGVAILLVSAELDEVLALADRVLVLYRGRIVLERAAPDVDREAIGRAMAGVA